MGIWFAPAPTISIVSAAFGPVVTGYYYRAYLLGVDYQNKFSRVLVQILFPLFSRAASRASSCTSGRRRCRGPAGTGARSARW